MKNIFSKSLLFCIAFFLLFSCSNNTGSQSSIVIEESLKDISDRREEELTWTHELESVRLIRDIKKTALVSPSLKLTPLIMTVSNAEKQPVYPSLDGFGSLNTSEITAELKNFLNAFCDKLSSWQFDEAAFEDGSIYCLVLFKYDVEKLWKQLTEKELVPAGENEKNFSRYIYGKPFIDQDQIEIPVRFVSDKLNLDIKLYVTQSESFKINQIEITALKQE